MDAAKNTDREIYREPSKPPSTDSYVPSGMEPYVFVTDQGAIGMNHFGKVVVKTIEQWVKDNFDPGPGQPDTP